MLSFNDVLIKWIIEDTYHDKMFINHSYQITILSTVRKLRSMNNVDASRKGKNNALVYNLKPLKRIYLASERATIRVK